MSSAILDSVSVSKIQSIIEIDKALAQIKTILNTIESENSRIEETLKYTNE